MTPTHFTSSMTLSSMKGWRQEILLLVLLCLAVYVMGFLTGLLIGYDTGFGEGLDWRPLPLDELIRLVQHG